MFKPILQQQVKGTFTQYMENPPARMTILRWVENFYPQGNVETTTVRERPSVLQRMFQTFTTHFRAYRQVSPRWAVLNLRKPYSTVQKLLKKQTRMSRYKIITFEEVKPQDDTQIFPFVQWCLENYFLT